MFKAVGIVIIMLLVLRVLPEPILETVVETKIVSSIIENMLDSYLEAVKTPTGDRKYSIHGSIAHFDDDARYQLIRVGLQYSIMDMEIGRGVLSNVTMYKVEDGLIYAQYPDGNGVLRYGILNMETGHVTSYSELSDLSDEEQEVFNNIKDMRVLSNSRFKNYVIINW